MVKFPKFFSKAPREVINGGVGGQIVRNTGAPARRKRYDYLSGVSDLPWLHAAVGTISRSVSTTDWQIHKRVGPGGKAIHASKAQRLSHDSRAKYLKRLENSGELAEVEDHPLLDLLEAGNEEMDGRTVMRLVSAYYELVGEAILIKERDGLNAPVGLWPVPPTWAVLRPTPAFPFFHFRHGTWDVIIPKEEVIFFRNPDPVSPYLSATSTPYALGDELTTDEMAAKHIAAYFHNQARPDLLIFGDGIDKDQTELLRQRWLDESRGYFKRGLPLFLGKKVEVKELNQTMQESQGVELRGFERDTIRQVFGIPPEIMGDIKNSNRATVDGAQYHYGKYVLVPRLDMIRATIQRNLVPDFDDRIIFDYESPVDEDHEFILKAAEKAPWSRSVNEWRDMQGLPPIDEPFGQSYPVPMSLSFSPEPFIESELSPDPGNMVGSEEPEALPVPKADDEEEPEEKAVKTPALTPVTKTVDSRYAVTVSEAIDDPTVLGKVESIIASLRQDLVVELGEEFIEEAGEELEFQVNSRITAFAREGTAQRVTLINQATRRDIQHIIEDAALEDESLDVTVGRLAGLFSAYKTTRAERIAQTELTMIAGYAAEESIVQSGVTRKQWITTRDGFERDTHAHLDEQVVKTSDPFTNQNGQTAMHPGSFGIAEEDINCRCAIAGYFGDGSERSAGDLDLLWAKRESSRKSRVGLYRNTMRQVFAIQAEAVVQRLREVGQ